MTTMKRDAALAVALLVGGMAAGQAQSLFTVNLDSAQEVGTGSNSGATGSGSLTLNVDGTVTYSISYAGLVGDYTASHIHGNAASFPGFNAGVIVGLVNTPDGTRAGLLQGTTAPLTAEQQGWMVAGSTYVNIHSAAFGGGEIRGQVVAVPEPGVLALGGLGLAALALGVRRRP